MASCTCQHRLCNYSDYQTRETEGLHCHWISASWLVNLLAAGTSHFPCELLWVIWKADIQRVLKGNWTSYWSPCVSRLQVVWVCGRTFSQCLWTTSLTRSTDRRWASPTWPSTSACEEHPPPVPPPHSPLHGSTSVQLTSAHFLPKPNPTSTSEV